MTTPFDADLPLARAWTLSADYYTDAAFYATERAKVFRSTWQYAARREQLAEAGQFVTLAVAGEPVLVVRQKDGALLAMANVCRHRAARVEPRAEGKASRFRCRYHGWAYDQKGALAGAPDFEGVEDFDQCGIQLPRYAVEEWGPFVFVHLGTPAESLAALLEPIARRTGLDKLSALKFGGRKVYEMQCNWKIFCDNYLDGGYHVPTLHPGLAKVVDMDGYHTILDGEASLQLSPLRKTTGERLDAELNAVRSGDAAHYWWVYPNFMLNAYEGTMDINIVLPLGHDRCLCIFDFFFQEVGTPQAAAYIESSFAVAHQVQLEDQEICEEVQRGLASAAYDKGRFSVRREAGGHHFHALLAKACT